MNDSLLTPATLACSLEAIRSVTTETECAAAVIFAASQLQQAILSDQEPDSIGDALDTCAEHLQLELGQVLERSVEFHKLENGSTLGLWLLPVIFKHSVPLPSALPLDARSINGLRLSSALLTQLGLATDFETRDPYGAAKNPGAGWVCSVPTLYSADHMQNSDLGDLIRLPHQAHGLVQGLRQRMAFDTESMDPQPPGVSLYFMPFVAMHPVGKPAKMPVASAQTKECFESWISHCIKTAFVADEVVANAVAVPQPFAKALKLGDRALLDSVFRHAMEEIIGKTQISPNGMSALVAPYVVGNIENDLRVGVSLISRMTQRIISTISFPVSSQNGIEEVSLLVRSLQELGMDCLEHQFQPIRSFACQHCGGLQVNSPKGGAIVQSPFDGSESNCSH